LTPTCDDEGVKPHVRQIVVPLDGAARHNTAVQIGAALGERLKLPVQLFSVVSHGMGSLDVTELSALASQLPGDVTAEVIESADLEELFAFATDPRTLLCFSTSARTAFFEALGKSVTSSLIRQASESLVVVGPSCEAQLRGEDFVIALDGTPGGEGGIPDALRLAKDLGLTPVLCHVLPSVAAVVPGFRRAEDYVADLVTRLRPIAPNVFYNVFYSHNVTSVLRNLSRHDEVAMMAVSTHGDDAFERLITPSVTYGVVRHARCPVLIGPRRLALGSLPTTAAQAR
jgi:nucleotide-binding universal stress UspA family protein